VIQFRGKKLFVLVGERGGGVWERLGGMKIYRPFNELANLVKQTFILMYFDGNNVGLHLTHWY